MKFKFTLDGQPFDWEQFIMGYQLRELGNVPPEKSIFQKIKGDDIEIEDDQQIDLSPNGTEHFTSKQTPGKNLVTIKVNKDDREIHRGRRSVAEIKAVGLVPAGEVLEQLINGVLTPLADDGHVVIKGGEIFFSHVPDGGSS